MPPGMVNKSANDENNKMQQAIEANQGKRQPCKTPVAVSAKAGEPITLGVLVHVLREALSTTQQRHESFSLSEVADYFGVHVRTAREWVDKGILPGPVIKNGRVSRWSRKQLEAVLDGCGSVHEGLLT